VRAAVRTSAVLFLGVALVHGGNQGGHFDYPGSPFTNLSGKFAGLFGLAAQNIHIDGLAHHEPEQVLNHIGVKPGSNLAGFDAEEARILLESLDWVADATVQRLFPNRLEITIAERVPFAIWQLDGSYLVLDPAMLKQLPLVTGKGANVAVVDYVNQMEAIPDVLLKIQAAARVGERRWTLYLDNGVKIALPEENVADALQRLAKLDAEQNILSKGIREIDLRSKDRMVIALAESVSPEVTGSTKKLNASQPVE
jgi:cell division protein FtsQ